MLAGIYNPSRKMAFDLKSQLESLKSLQDADLELHKVLERLDAIPSKIDQAKAVFEEFKTKVTSKEEEKAKAEKDKRTAELDLEAEITKIKDREVKLYAIKTNKEYQAALKEIADSKQLNKQREEDIIKLMEALDIASKEITQLSSELADKKAEYEKTAEGLKNEGIALAAEKEKWLAVQKELETKLEPEVLKQYRLIQSRFHDALAVASAGICTGCNKKIPPQLYIELQKWKELITCPNCRRILIVHNDQKKEG